MKNTRNLYAEQVGAITPDELYEGLLAGGLFPEKLPPIFTGGSFYNYCVRHKDRVKSFPYTETPYVFYESIRNTNNPRPMGIPSPIGYAMLCCYLKEKWSELLKHFEEQTDGQEHKISRIHVRKIKGDKHLFEMSYKNWKMDGDIEPTLLFGAQYLVTADISKCFPSIYTHSLPWALLGKETGKKERGKNKWDKLDKLTRAIKHGETTGLLIGPHASNLLSEIVLTVVDKELVKKGYTKFIRNVDDYSCYVKDTTEAQRFLVSLGEILRTFGLAVNHGKTKVLELPIGSEEEWVRKIKDYVVLFPGRQLRYPVVRAYMDFLVDLLRKNDKNSAILNYGLQILSKRGLSPNAREYYINFVLHLALIYPYLFPLLEKLLLVPFSVDVEKIKKVSEQIYESQLRAQNYEGVCYALYFAVKYGFKIREVRFCDAQKSKNSVFLLLAWLYTSKNRMPEEVRYVKHGIRLLRNKDEFHRNWIFVYEVLQRNDFLPNAKWKDAENLASCWEKIKADKVSFVKPLEEICLRQWDRRDEIWFDCTLNSTCDKFTEIVTVIVGEIEKDVFPIDGRRTEDMRKREALEGPMFDHKSIHECVSVVISNLAWGFLCETRIIFQKSNPSESEPSDDGNTRFGGKDRFMGYVMDWLKNNYYISMERGCRSDDDQVGRVSSYWANEKLYCFFLALRYDMFCRRIDDSVVVLKDDKKICKYEETDVTKEMWKRITEINNLYAKTVFVYNPSCRDVSERIFPRLVRIFNRGDWQYGGRLYDKPHQGLSYQGISKKDRERIVITGQRTKELDYCGLHMSMLYAYNNFELVEDPYVFLGKDLRAAVKVLMMVFINCKTEKDAFGWMEERLSELRGAAWRPCPNEEQEKTLLERYCSDFSVLLEIFRNAHPKIAKHFFSDAGILLQKKDSEMALEIVYQFAQQGIPVLPIHDSFIIDRRYVKKLNEQMDITFRSHNNGIGCKVK